MTIFGLYDNDFKEISELFELMRHSIKLMF